MGDESEKSEKSENDDKEVKMQLSIPTSKVRYLEGHGEVKEILMLR